MIGAEWTGAMTDSKVQSYAPGVRITPEVDAALAADPAA